MRVTVFGSARLPYDSAGYADGLRLGRMLAERGDVVVSGGYAGIMEAVSRGAREAGGQVVGVTVAPWIGRIAPNRFLSEEVSARTLFERLEALVESEALIALPGGAGTLGEVALAWNLRQMDLMPRKPVVLVGRDWKAILDACARHLVIDEADLALLTTVETIEEALAALDEHEPTPGDWHG
jgi:uncharacterized protein (TIGR00725 family)